MNEKEQKYLLRSIEVAINARDHGNLPFGAILVDNKGNILLEAENTTTTDHDATGHAETNLVRKATKKFDTKFLNTCTLFASTEPCCMCAGAIYWSGIGNVVYALSDKNFVKTFIKEELRITTMNLPCKEVFERGTYKVQVKGPFELDEAYKVHEGFWDHQK